MSLLSVDDLCIGFRHKNKIIPRVHDLSFTLGSQETLAFVGGSGSGKTITALSLLQLLPKESVAYPKGDIHFKGMSILNAPESTLRAIRAQQIGMIFQDAYVALNPLHTIGKQLHERLIQKKPHLTARDSLEEILACLDRVGFSNAKERLSFYPHQLSGGECQRIMIAMAILTRPQLLIADEPTKALDNSVQKQIVALLQELKTELNMSLLFITHNLSLVKKMADNVLVIKDGVSIEYAKRQRIFLRPAHSYTRALLKSELSGDPPPKSPDAAILLNVQHLEYAVPIRSRSLFSRKKNLIKNINFSLYQGESIGLVGASGSGKTTTALATLKLISSVGSIQFDGHRLDKLSRRRLRPFRQDLQIVFQDPYASLNPRLSVETLVKEGLIVHRSLSKAEIDCAVRGILQEVGIDPERRHHFVQTFSGGERQRIAIARALILRPQIVILDEPTSLLDHVTQKQIIDLLQSLQQKYKLSYIFISHDLTLIHALCHHVLIMHEGKIIEQGSRDAIFNEPKEIYTQRFIQEGFPRHQYSRSYDVSHTDNKNWKDALLFGQTRQNIK